MSTTISNPPQKKEEVEMVFENFDNNLHFYLAYKYLPLSNIGMIFNEVNNLFEITYSILYEETPPINQRLILEHATTGNSFEWVATIIEKNNPSKKALNTIFIIGLILATPFGVEAYRGKIQDRLKNRAQTEAINLENKLKRNQIEKDSIDLLIKKENLKKIQEKKELTYQYIDHKAIYYCTINDIEVLKR